LHARPTTSTWPSWPPESTASNSTPAKNSLSVNWPPPADACSSPSLQPHLLDQRAVQVIAGPKLGAPLRMVLEPPGHERQVDSHGHASPDQVEQLHRSGLHREQLAL